MGELLPNTMIHLSDQKGSLSWIPRPQLSEENTRNAILIGQDWKTKTPLFAVEPPTTVAQELSV